MSSHKAGFTAVELLVTMIIGSLMLLTAYQLYTFVLNDSADARMRATASNLAYRFMRERSGTDTTCPAITNPTTYPSIPAGSNLPNASATVNVTCITNDVTLPKITSTVSYGNGKSISHATYLPAN